MLSDRLLLTGVLGFWVLAFLNLHSAILFRFFLVCMGLTMAVFLFKFLWSMP